MGLMPAGFRNPFTKRDQGPVMNVEPRWIFIAAGMVAPVLAIMPPGAEAQTPSQMEYERQQREYRQQQEQQRQDQQRQQQLMNENARRQQEEASRLNAPVGQSHTPAYPGPSPQPACGPGVTCRSMRFPTCRTIRSSCGPNGPARVPKTSMNR